MAGLLNGFAVMLAVKAAVIAAATPWTDATAEDARDIAAGARGVLLVGVVFLVMARAVR